MKKLFLISLIFFIFINHLQAQEVRASDYQSIPLIINPALTGYFEAGLRVTGYQAFIKSDSGNNMYSNVSADFRFGNNQSWAIGVNYFRSGYKEFQVSSSFIGLSIAKEWVLDNEGINTLRIGFQVSKDEGNLNESRGRYYKYSDVNVIKVFPSSVRPIGYPLVDVTMSYINFSTGFFYRYLNNDIKFETGMGIYNFLNPNFSPSPWYTDFKKRNRVAIHNSLSYFIDESNTLQFSYLLWKEGMYLHDFEPTRAGDTDPIQEDLFGVSWQRYLSDNSKSLTIQITERSLKSIIATLGMNFNQNFKLNLSYEQPIHSPYYDVKHLELSFALLFGNRSDK